MGCASADNLHAVGLVGGWQVGAHTCTLFSAARTSSHALHLAGWLAGVLEGETGRSIITLILGSCFTCRL